MTAFPITSGERSVKGIAVLNPGLLWNLENKASKKKEIVARSISHRNNQNPVSLSLLKGTEQ